MIITDVGIGGLSISYLLHVLFSFFSSSKEVNCQDFFHKYPHSIEDEVCN